VRPERKHSYGDRQFNAVPIGDEVFVGADVCGECFGFWLEVEDVAWEYESSEYFSSE
jgi:hypothetical protein